MVGAAVFELPSTVGAVVSDIPPMLGTLVSAGEGEILGTSVSTVGDEGKAGAAAGELAGAEKQLLQISN